MLDKDTLKLVLEYCFGNMRGVRESNNFYYIRDKSMDIFSIIYISEPDRMVYNYFYSERFSIEFPELSRLPMDIAFRKLLKLIPWSQCECQGTSIDEILSIMVY